DQLQLPQREIERGRASRHDLAHPRLDRRIAQRSRDRDAVMAVLDEVEVADADDVDRGHVLPTAPRGRDALPAALGLPRRGPEAAVELAAATVDRAHDRVQ